MPIRFEGLTLYTADELSEKLGVSTGTVSKMLREGRIKGRKMARRWFVTEDALRYYFEGGILTRNGAALQQIERLLSGGAKEKPESAQAGAALSAKAAEPAHGRELGDLIMQRFRESLREEASKSSRRSQKALPEWMSGHLDSTDT